MCDLQKSKNKLGPQIIQPDTNGLDQTIIQKVKMSENKALSGFFKKKKKKKKKGKKKSKKIKVQDLTENDTNESNRSEPSSSSSMVELDSNSNAEMWMKPEDEVRLNPWSFSFLLSLTFSLFSPSIFSRSISTFDRYSLQHTASRQSHRYSKTLTGGYAIDRHVP